MAKRRRRKSLSFHQKAEMALHREGRASVARDLAAERDRENIRTEQARLKAEAMARVNRP